MDPVIVFSRFLDVPEMIFQHLTGKELLMLSETSQDWFILIGSSKKLMAKIKFILECYKGFSPHYSELRRAISRRYQNIEIRCSPKGSFCCSESHREIKPWMLNFFKESNHDWKDFKFNRTYFNGKRKDFDFFTAIESTVESVDLQYPKVMYDPPYGNFEVLTFPLLKKVTLCHRGEGRHRESVFCNRFFESIFSNCVNLEELELDVSSQSEDLLINLLSKNEKLKSLTLNCQRMWHLKKPLPELKIKLQSFVCTMRCWLTFAQPYKVHNENIAKFMSSQFESLEVLRLDHNVDFVLFDAIMKMQRLKVCHLLRIPLLQSDEQDNSQDWKTVHLEESASIVDFKLELACSNSTFIKAFMGAAPNLEKLGFESIDKDSMDYLLSTQRKLKTFCLKQWKGLKDYEQKIKEDLAEKFILDQVSRSPRFLCQDFF